MLFWALTSGGVGGKAESGGNAGKSREMQDRGGVERGGACLSGTRKI